MKTGVVIKNSEELAQSLLSLELPGTSVVQPVSDRVADSIERFNEHISETMSWYVHQPIATRGKLEQFAHTGVLTLEERDELEAILRDYGNWIILRGERGRVYFGIKSQYSEDEINKYLREYMIFNGRLCGHCPAETMPLTYLDRNKWVCPHCNRKVSVYAGTDIPLGSVCDTDTSTLRREAHAALDPIWQTSLMTRNDLYTEMSKLIKRPACYTHIGMLDAKQCENVIKWASALRKEKEKEKEKELC